MAIITEHEFVASEDGELALIIEALDDAITELPTLVVVRAEATASLNLGAEASHDIVGINPDVLERLCGAESLLVVELKGDAVHRTYDAVVGVDETE